MANTNSLTIGNTTLPVANSLASLDDTSTSNATAGNILTFNGTAWTKGALTGNNGVSVSRNGVNYTLSGDASWTKRQAIAAPLTGLNTSLTGAVTASDTVVNAIGKLQNSAQQEQVAITHFIDCLANPASQSVELPSSIFSWAFVMLRRVGTLVTARFRAKVRSAGACRVSIPHAFIPADDGGLTTPPDGHGGTFYLNFNAYNPSDARSDNTLWILVSSTPISSILDSTVIFHTPF